MLQLPTVADGTLRGQDFFSGLLTLTFTGASEVTGSGQNYFASGLTEYLQPRSP